MLSHTGPTTRSDGERVAAFLAELDRVVERLRTMAESSLAAVPDGEARTRAHAAHDMAQSLADGALDAMGQPRRVLPRLSDLAVGDQLAVTGHDLAASGAPLEPAVELLRRLRRTL